ncbi:MAG: amidase family protein, partial [Candidatus Competibacterales bacterium]
LDHLIVAEDAFARVEPAAAAVLQPAVQALVRGFRAGMGTVDTVTLAPEGLEGWRQAFRIHQGFEIWQTHGPRIEAYQPDFGPGIKERLAWTATIDPATFEEAVAVRRDIRRQLVELLTPRSALLIPTAPDIAPLKDLPAPELEAFRNRALELLCIAGHAGLPQVNLPGLTREGCPLGLSLAGPPGSDRALMALAAALAAHLDPAKT